MSWSEIFLAVIALATLVMALIQVGAIVAVSRVARDAQKTLLSVQNDFRPLMARVQAVADEASKTATIATAQAQKVDRLVSDLTQRIDETSVVVQQAILTPARETMAVVAAVRATLGALRDFRSMSPRNGRTTDEEDPLFIG